MHWKCLAWCLGPSGCQQMWLPLSLLPPSTPGDWGPGGEDLTGACCAEKAGGPAGGLFCPHLSLPFILPPQEPPCCELTAPWVLRIVK